jgi:hypothetical protein
MFYKSNKGNVMRLLPTIKLSYIFSTKQLNWLYYNRKYIRYTLRRGGHLEGLVPSSGGFLEFESITNIPNVEIPYHLEFTIEDIRKEIR